MPLNLLNRRFTLAAALLVLLGGALALWRTAEPPAPAAPPSGSYVLAISWHPAFCETAPDLGECRDAEGAYTATHLALHGLWPRGSEYCGVSDELAALDAGRRWHDLPAIEVDDALAARLRRVMPGTAAALDRHEWLLHGTCSGATAQTYFARAVTLLDAVNASPVRDLLARNAGRHVSRSQVRAAFDAAFGAGAGRKVRLDCADDSGRTLISELRLNLTGDVMGSTPLDDLLHAGRNAGAGCTGGIVDRPGRR